MTVFEACKNYHFNILVRGIGIKVTANSIKHAEAIYNNSMRMISLHNEYLLKYGDYSHMSREQRLSANLLPAFDKEHSIETRLDCVALVVAAYSLANIYTVYESTRFSLYHWRDIVSVSNEEIETLVDAFEQRINEKGISTSTIIDPFDSEHMKL